MKNAVETSVNEVAVETVETSNVTLFDKNQMIEFTFDNQNVIGEIRRVTKNKYQVRVVGVKGTIFIDKFDDSIKASDYVEIPEVKERKPRATKFDTIVFTPESNEILNDLNEEFEEVATDLIEELQ